MTIAVIGAGLWGSAAARHLSKAGAKVLLIGPPEPTDRARHRGPFASWHDEGRITRRNDADPYWVEINSAALARYPEIEAESGIAFHTPCGGLMMGPEGGAYETAIGAGARAAGVASERMGHGALTARFPWLTPPAGWVGHVEAPPAGHVSPRRLVAAQIAAARRHGATYRVATVTGLRVRDHGVDIETDQGGETADQVIVAAGAWTDPILGRAPTLSPKARTVVLAQTDAATRASLDRMPHIIFRREDGGGIYILPPIRYPDGQWYVKIGGDPFLDTLPDRDAVDAWFRGPGHPKAIAYLRQVLAETIPALADAPWHSLPCVTTFPETGYPEVARIAPRITVCAGGCGAGAKNADEFGRRAAAIALGADAPVAHPEGSLP